MSNKDLIKVNRNMNSKQLQDFLYDLDEGIQSGQVQDEGSILHKMFTGVKQLFIKAGKPTLKKRLISKGSPPKSSHINETFKEVYNDTTTMFDEQTAIGDAARRSFNYSVTDRLRLKNKVKKIGEMVNDYIVTANNTLSRNIVIQDSFLTKDLVDLNGLSNPVNVSESEGFVTLGIVGENRKTEGALISGSPELNHPSAMPSNFLIPYKKNIDNSIANSMSGNSDSDQWDLLYNLDRHDSWSAVFDDQPNTWIEYQLINFDIEKTKDIHKSLGLEFSAGKSIYGGDKDSDYLTLSFTIRLKEPSIINKIVINPYIPDEAGSSYRLRVNEISTSESISDKDHSIFLDKGDENQLIGGDSMSRDSVIEVGKKDRDKFKGKGVWLFPARKVEYIKVKLTCEAPYETIIGHLFWETSYQIETTTTKSSWFGLVKDKSVSTGDFITERRKGPEIDKKLLENFESTDLNIARGAVGAAAGYGLGLGMAALAGMATIPVVGLVTGAIGLISGLFGSTKQDQQIVNQQTRTSYGIDIFDGWRWVIGLRSFDAYIDRYSTKSVFVSQNMQLPKAISDVSLSVSEMIPEEFWSNNISTKNDWIKYSLSFDNGKTWTAISPLEREPVNFAEENFPNKILSVNKNISVDARTPNKSYVLAEGEVKQIKLKAEFSRPEKLDSITPILYDYQLRIVPMIGDEED